MANTSLGKLQCQNDKLLKDNTRLRDTVESLRTEIYQLKRQFKQYKENVDSQIEKAVTQVVEKVKGEYEKIIEEKDARIFQLEKRLNISSKTSSLPPSMDPLWVKDTKVYDTRSTSTTTNKKGGQIGHKKNQLNPFMEEEITKKIDYKLDKCTNCENDHLEFIGIENRDELEFKVVVEKIRHSFYKYHCTKCNKIITTSIPKNLHAKNQYGSAVQTLGLVLVDFGDVSYKRTRDIIRGLTNGEIDPSEGYLAKLPKRASLELQDFIFDCEEDIVHSEVVQHDDGVIKIGKSENDLSEELKELLEKQSEKLTDEEKEKINDTIKKNFSGVIRAYTNGQVKLYKAHTTKEAKTYDEDNILKRLTNKTTVVHDHMKYNYNDAFSFENAECNIHPIRKGRGIKANTQHTWPDKIAELLEEYNGKKKENIKNSIFEFTIDELNDLSNHYDKIIDEGLVECNTFKHKHLYSDERNLLEFFQHYKKEVLAWAYNYKLPFTNNLCESMIRLVKSKMKISYSFKNINTARYYADVISYTETCYNFGIERYQALNRLFSGNPYTIQELKDLKKLK